jgi:hypothetical protein
MAAAQNCKRVEEEEMEIDSFSRDKSNCAAAGMGFDKVF